MEKLLIVLKIEFLKIGVAQADIARELQVSQAAISQFVSGKTKSKKFDNWVRKNVGLDMKILRDKRGL